MASKTWETMNDLQMVTSKIVSAREIIDAAIDRIQEHQYDKAETMMAAAHEFLGYYLDEFDEKFKLAWKETVGKEKEEEITLNLSDLYVGYGNTAYSTCSPDDDSEFCNNSWTSFWENDTIQNKEKEAAPSNKKWILQVEVDGPSGEYFITFPDDLLEAADLKEGDEVYWDDKGDGTCILKKVGN